MKFLKTLLICGLFASSSSLQARPKVVAYVPIWIDLEKFAQTIVYEKITHLNIAFENPVDDEGNLSFNPANLFVLGKAKAAGVKVLVSIGGGSASGDPVLKKRYLKLLSEKSREAFSKKLGAYLVKHDFDGIDIDIEGPSITDDYGGFIAALAVELKLHKKLLTAALSKGYGGDRVTAETLTHFDFLNIMAYDATGTWDRERAGQHSSIEFAKQQVDYWLKRGLPASKAVLGVPFYGYGFKQSWRNYGYPYSEIVGANPEAAKVDESGATIYYNGIPTISAKARYVIDQKLGGIMIWSLDQDAAGELSLLSTIDSILRKPQPPKLK